MVEMTRYEHGTPSWVDVGTTDREAGRRFYEQLFGWRSEVGPPETGGYTMFFLRDKPVAALMELTEEMRAQGIPPAWSTYVAVDDLDATVATVEPAGGKIVMGPMDVMDFGRMAMVADPTGAVVGMWQARSFPGAGLVNEPGSLCWNEVLTTDTDAAAGFYRQVFGWEPRPMDMEGTTYTVWHLGERAVGGMMPLTEQMAGAPPHWAATFAVADCDETVKRAEQLGGRALVPPMDCPIGRYAHLADPQGAAFGVIAMSAEGPAEG
jgi:predicted enzyme related to lactoylglutathione lyase